MAWVEIPAPADTVLDAAGNVVPNEAVTLKIAGTSTDVTHAADTDGTGQTTGGLITLSDGSVGAGGVRRYIQSGAPVELTVDGRTRLLQPVGARSQVPVENVKDYGAVGDGATNDTTAIQAAITAAAAAGRNVFLPAGTYNYTNLTVPVQSGGALRIFGAGIGKTTLSQTSTGHGITLGDGTATDTRWQFISDLSMAGTSSADSAIRLNSTRFCGVERVRFTSAYSKAGAACIDFVAGVANYFTVIRHCSFNATASYGVRFRGTAGVGGNANTVEQCWFGSQASASIYLNGGTGNRITCNEFTVLGIDCDASDDNFIYANRFDGPTTSIDLDSSSDRNLFLFNTGGAITNASASTVILDSTAPQSFTLGDVALSRSAADILATPDDFAVSTAGKGLRVKEGSNAKMGVATLVGGTVTVSNTAVTANSRILLTNNNGGGTPGFLRISARNAGTNFTILSSSGTDTSQVAWMLVEPA